MPIVSPLSIAVLSAANCNSTSCLAGTAPAETEFASRLGEIARLHLIQFRLAFAEGDLVAAAEEAFRLEKIGHLISTGEGQMLHYLIGLWLLRRGGSRLRARGREHPCAGRRIGANTGSD